jgi:hypothetical protein
MFLSQQLEPINHLFGKKYILPGKQMLTQPSHPLQVLVLHFHNFSILKKTFQQLAIKLVKVMSEFKQES